MGFILRGTETGGSRETFELLQRTDSLFDGPMVLLQSVIGIACRAMGYGGPKLQPNCPRVRTMAIGGDTARTALAKQTHGAEESTGGAVCDRVRRSHARSAQGATDNHREYAQTPVEQFYALAE